MRWKAVQDYNVVHVPRWGRVELGESGAFIVLQFIQLCVFDEKHSRCGVAVGGNFQQKCTNESYSCKFSLSSLRGLFAYVSEILHGEGFGVCLLSCGVQIKLIDQNVESKNFDPLIQRLAAFRTLPAPQLTAEWRRKIYFR